MCFCFCNERQGKMNYFLRPLCKPKEPLTHPDELTSDPKKLTKVTFGFVRTLVLTWLSVSFGSKLQHGRFPFQTHMLD